MVIVMIMIMISMLIIILLLIINITTATSTTTYTHNNTNRFASIRRNHSLENKKIQFEILQSELESIVEMLSDVLARRRLRASKDQIVQLTKGEIVCMCYFCYYHHHFYYYYYY